MFTKIKNNLLRSKGLKERKRTCDCDDGHWCQKCFIEKLSKNFQIYTGKSADGSDMKRLK